MGSARLVRVRKSKVQDHKTMECADRMSADEQLRKAAADAMMDIGGGSVGAAPAAPAPTATKKIEISELKNEIFSGAVKRPTVQVNITNDITRGFINNKKDFI